MSRRAAVVLAVALIAVVGSVLAVVLLRSEPAPGLPKLQADPAKGLVAARAACERMATLEELVASNSAVKPVFAAADAASASGKTAAARDVRWVPLSSGIEAVRIGLKKNDAAAASVGIRSTRSQCDLAAAEAP
jgi:hypothetical protein